MKTFFVVIAGTIAMGCYAQTNVPAAVKTAFEKKFPGIEVKKWEKENDDFEASFSDKGKHMSATFTATGNWLETETDIDKSLLPAAAVSYIKTTYKTDIKEASEIITPNGKMYEAEVKDVDVMFDESGRFIKQEKD